QRLRAKYATFGRTNTPLFTVRIIDRLADGIIRHYINNQIFRAIVDELMWLIRLEDESVTRFDGRRTLLVAHLAAPGNHVVKFPLRAVQMIWVWNLAWLNADDLHIEGMPLHQIRRLRIAAQCFGNFFACAGEF